MKGNMNKFGFLAVLAAVTTVAHANIYHFNQVATHVDGSAKMNFWFKGSVTGSYNGDANPEGTIAYMATRSTRQAVQATPSNSLITAYPQLFLSADSTWDATTDFDAVFAPRMHSMTVKNLVWSVNTKDGLNFSSKFSLGNRPFLTQNPAGEVKPWLNMRDFGNQVVDSWKVIQDRDAQGQLLPSQDGKWYFRVSVPAHLEVKLRDYPNVLQAKCQWVLNGRAVPAAEGFYADFADGTRWFNANSASNSLGLMNLDLPVNANGDLAHLVGNFDATRFMGSLIGASSTSSSYPVLETDANGAPDWSTTQNKKVKGK